MYCDVFLENGKCVNECSENYAADNNNICKCDIEKYVLTENSQCMLTCPEDSILNEITRKCELIPETISSSDVKVTADYCKQINKKLENEQCVDFCSLDYSYHSFINICVPQCDVTYVSFYDGSENVCTKCNTVIENNLCVDSCSKSLAPNKHNVCKPCIDSTMIYKLDGKCVSNCPPKYEPKDLYGERTYVLL